jgi:hypothetical protein
MTVTSNAGAAAVGQHAALFELADATSGANLLTGLQRPQPGALASHFGHKQQPQHPPTCPHAAGARLPGGQHQAHAAAPTPAAQQSPRDGSAAQLNQQLGSLEAGDSLRRTVLGLGNDGTSGGTAGHLPSPAAQAGQRVGLGSMVLRVGDMLQPQGEAHGDATLGERAANVLTSLPFLALGWHMHRQRLTPEGRHHAVSMAAVGVAATLYHASSGAARRLARKADYWTIAYTSSAMVRPSPTPISLQLFAFCFYFGMGGTPLCVCCGGHVCVYASAPARLLALLRDPACPPGCALPPTPSSPVQTKALFADSPPLRRAASLSLLAVPFRPFAVSTANTVLMQAEFARQAAAHKAVRRDLRRHYAAAALGVAAFFGEDLLTHTGYSGFVHSAWHCLAAYSMFTLNGLLAHNERQLLQRQARAAAPATAAKPLRRPLHSSASSLPSYGGGGKLAGGSPGTVSP